MSARLAELERAIAALRADHDALKERVATLEAENLRLRLGEYEYLYGALGATRVTEESALLEVEEDDAP